MQPELEVQEMQAKARTRWKNAGVELADGPMTPKELAEYLRIASAYAQTTPGRFSPSSFSDDDPALTIFPRAESWKWHSAEETLSKHMGRGLMLRLPLFWQVEIPLFLACKEKGLFIFVNDQSNMALGASAISRASIGVVVTDAKDANEFATFLMIKGHSFPDTWLIVQKAGEMIPLAPALTGSASTLVQEVHVLPGVPILEQCVHIAGKEHVFHVSDDYVWGHGPRAHITSRADDPLPLIQYETDLATEEAGICSCGKKIIHAQNA